MIPLKSPTPENKLINTISYFTFFEYPPNFEEIHTFFPEKITKKGLQCLLERLIREKEIICHCEEESKRPTKQSRLGLIELQNNPSSTFYLPPSDSPRYTLPQYLQTSHQSSVISRQKKRNLFDTAIQRRKITEQKLTSVYRFVKLLGRLPFIQYVGITGSASMGNCKQRDDVDLCIITSPNILFIARFALIVLMKIMDVRRGPNSICLNLFFDELDLLVPTIKQTNYVAHEILQMKPIINKNHTYERFMKKNEWIYKIYPNSNFKSQMSNLHLKSQNSWKYVICYMLYVILFPLELILKYIQLAIIRKNKTGLIITPKQLWLFKRDFEKKIQTNLF